MEFACSLWASKFSGERHGGCSWLEKQCVLLECSEKRDISPVLMYVGALCDEKVEEMALSQAETLTSPGF